MSAFSKIFGVVAILVVARLSVYTVDAGEFAYVTVLGRHEETFDGASGGAGLHFGWPWPIQTVQRLDRRTQQFDLPATEHLTRDVDDKVDKNLSIEAYVVWRIHDPNAANDEDAVNRFVTRIGSQDRVRSILAPRIISKLGALVGQKRMDEFINTKKGIVDEKMAELRDELLGSLKETGSLKNQVLKEYGIELIDIRLRRFNYPKATSNDIFARIRAERQKKAEDYRAEGDREAQNKISEANAAYRTVLAEANRKAERLKGEADAEAMRIRNEAHRQDPKFYEFVKDMEKLSSILTEKGAVLLLSAQRPLFQRLFNPPQAAPEEKENSKK